MARARTMVTLVGTLQRATRDDPWGSKKEAGDQRLPHLPGQGCTVDGVLRGRWWGLEATREDGQECRREGDRGPGSRPIGL